MMKKIIKIDDNYTNFQPFQSKIIQQQTTLNAIILGYSGSGKTSLFNNLCGTSEPTGFAQQNLTSLITSADCNLLLKNSLHLYDTPGIFEGSNAGLLQIQRSLYHLTWNLIIIMVRFDVRFKQNTLYQLKKFIKLFKNCFPEYMDSLLLMISNIDVLDDVNMNSRTQKLTLNNYLQNIQQISKEQKIILFSNINSNFKTLSQIIYWCAQQNKPKNLIFNSNIINKYLGSKLIDDPYKQIVIQYFKKLQYQCQNRNTIDQFIQLIDSIPSAINQLISKQCNNNKKGLILICIKYLQQKIKSKGINMSMIKSKNQPMESCKSKKIIIKNSKLKASQEDISGEQKTISELKQREQQQKYMLEMGDSKLTSIIQKKEIMKAEGKTENFGDLKIKDNHKKLDDLETNALQNKVIMERFGSKMKQNLGDIDGLMGKLDNSQKNMNKINQLRRNMNKNLNRVDELYANMWKDLKLISEMRVAMQKDLTIVDLLLQQNEKKTTNSNLLKKSGSQTFLKYYQN